MKKTSFLMAAICVIGLIVPQLSFAKLVQLSDGELRAITGQAGIGFTAADVALFNNHAIANGWSTSAEENHREVVQFGAPDVAVSASASNLPVVESGMKSGVERGVIIPGPNVQGMTIAVNRMDVNIDRINSNLQIGDANFGSFGMKNVQVSLSGYFHVFTRQ